MSTIVDPPPERAGMFDPAAVAQPSAEAAAVEGGGNGWAAVQSVLIAVLAVAAAVGLRFAFGAAGIKDLPLFITFYPAVALVALWRGGRAGAVATILSGLAAVFFFVVPCYSFLIHRVEDGVAMTLFLSAGVIISVLAARLDGARQRAARAEERENSRQLLAVAAAQTERHRHMLAITLASIGDGVIVTDAAGRVTFLNNEASRLTGWSASESLDKPLPEVFRIINQYSRLTVENPVDKVLRDGLVVGLANHTLLIAKDGREIPIDDSGAPIRHGDGAIQGAILVFRDFTERQQHESQLQRLNRTLRAFGHIRQAMLRATTEAELLSAVCRIIVEDCGHAVAWVGFARHDAAKTVEAVAYAGCPASYFEKIRVTWAETPLGQGLIGTAIRTGQTNHSHELRTAARFAPWREHGLIMDFASAIAVPLKSQDEVLGAISIYSREVNAFASEEIALLTELASDISFGLSALRAAASFRTSEERYRRLFNAMTEGFALHEIVTDAQGQPIDYRFLDINPAFEELTGLRREQVIGKTVNEVLPGDNSVWIERYGKVALSGQAVQFENYAPALKRHYQVFAHRPASNQFAVMFVDITARKEAGEQLQAAKAAAEEANRAKDHFLAVLSHELRTPLSPVLATASLLERDGAFPQAYRDDMTLIRRNVELEVQLIDDLLDVTRIIRGKLELHRRPIALEEVIRRTIEICQNDLADQGVELAVDLGAAGNCLIDADAARLQQAFWNLLKNAIKFTPRTGRITIRSRLDGPGVVLAEISDTGVGIAPENLTRLFSPFEQGGTSITRQFGGLGLGLTITKGVIELHGGSIMAQSPGLQRGTTFAVRLPVYADQGKPAACCSTAAPAAEPAARRPEALNVLLVEDHSDTAKAFRRLLAVDGHRVQWAADVATALELLGQQTFDLLLSDVGLPDGSGHDLLRTARSRGHSFPAIAISGFGLDADVQRSREAGFLLHLTKPTTPERLSQAIATAVQSRC